MPAVLKCFIWSLRQGVLLPPVKLADAIVRLVACGRGKGEGGGGWVFVCRASGEIVSMTLLWEWEVFCRIGLNAGEGVGVWCVWASLVIVEHTEMASISTES